MTGVQALREAIAQKTERLAINRMSTAISP